jgi:two-component system, OmpR family, aerobic respiration control sensor histidine kinase ArcB
MIKPESDNNIYYKLLITITDNLPFIAYYKNINGVYLWHSSLKPEDIQKYALKSKNIVGKTDYKLFSLYTAKKYKQHDLEAILSKTSVIKEEVGYYPDGEAYICLSYKKAINNDEQNKIIGILGIVMDLTAIRREITL